VKRWLIFLVSAALLPTGCGTVAGTDWGTAWEDKEGNEVSGNIVHSALGATHCDWESVVFLWVRWPFVTDSGGGWMYVRDPDEKTGADSFKTTFARDVTLPRRARFTGYSREDVELWASRASVEREVYLLFPNRVERWPRADPEFGCA
jgi:hypothetical protein